MTAIVIDDERPARTHLKRMLAAQQVEVVGEGSTGVEALQLCSTLQADLLFMDIQMPDLTGMQAVAALRQLNSPPLLIFVTGYSEHAARAFECAALDYLLKPVEPDRLALTLARARTQCAEKTKAVEEPLASRRLPVRTDYAIKLIRIDEIDYALAREKRVYLRIGETEQKTYYPLVQLEKLLPSSEFLRIHASVIVRLSIIDSLNFLGNHSYSATLANGVTLPVGRSYYPELQRRLGIDAPKVAGT